MKKRKVTVPRIYRPGPGHPAETLAYLNPMEHELIRQLTDGTAQRGPGGVRSYADDSASSKGVSRGDTSGTKGSGGLGQGGQAGGSASGSKASGSPSGGVSTGGANRGGNSGVSGSKGGGASTQAPGAGGNAGMVSRGGLSNAAASLSNTRNTAMGQVSQAAKANASMSNPVSFSGAMDGGYYHQFSNSLPGMKNPNQFDRTISPLGMVNANHVPVASWSQNSRGKTFNPNELTAQTQKQYQAIVDTALRIGTPVSFFSGKDPRSTGTKNHPSGQAMDLRVNDPVTGQPVGGVTNPIRQESLIGKPYTQFAQNVFDTVYQNPDVYSGLKGSMRWGGNFGDVQKDWMHFDTRSSAGLSQMAQNFNQQASARAADGTLGSGTMLAGNYPSATYAGLPQAPNPPSAQPLGARPAPTQVASAMPTDPRLGITPFANLPSAPNSAPNIVAANTQPAAISDAAPSFWQQAGNFVKAKTNEVQKKITENKPMLDWAGRHPTLAKIGISLMNAPGGKANNSLGTPQDRSGYGRMPVNTSVDTYRMAQGAPTQNFNPLQVLNNLHANMIAKGASPEQVAYVQSLIDELSKTQVA